MKKKPFVLRLNPVMMQKLEQWASDEFRSLNGQIEWILHQALKEAGRGKSLNTNPDTKDPHTKNMSHDEQFMD